MDEIAAALPEIFASSLVTGEVPGNWRVANVVTLFKKGSKDKQVTLKSVVRKLLDVMFRDRIHQHLDRH